MDTVPTIIMWLTLCLTCTRSCQSSGRPRITPNGTYVPVGRIVSIPDGISVYEVGTGSNLLFVLSDVYGIESEQIKQLSDLFASDGNRVIMPDFFNGNPWNDLQGPPADYLTPSFKDFMEKQTWEASAHDILSKVTAFYQSQGVDKIGLIGFKYGGNKVALASNEMASSFQFAVQAFPAPKSLDLAREIQIPTLIFSDIKDNTSLTWENYCSAAYVTCQGRDYPLLYATGTESNWQDKSIREASEEQMEIMITFICKMSSII